MKLIKTLISLSCLTLMSSCFNDGYDLSDIDTSIGVSVNGLDVPINMEQVKLERVLDIDEGSIIHEDSDGYYMLKDGAFGPSKPVNVRNVTIGGVTVSPIVSTLELHKLCNSKKKLADNLLGYYMLKVNSGRLTTNATNVDKAILDIKKAVTEAYMSFELKVQGLPEALTVHLEDVELSLIKGVEVDVDASRGVKSWDKQTGRLRLNDLQTDANGVASVKIAMVGIELADYNWPDVMFRNNTITIDTQCIVESGRISVYANAIDSSKIGTLQLPDEICFTCSPVLSDIVIKRFSGDLSYDVTSLNINPVELTGIPDLLSQTGTVIGLDNPQVYIEINNPLSGYDLRGRTQLAVQGERDGKLYDKVLSDEITVTNQPMNYFCFSPEKPATPYEYKDKQMEYVRFDVRDLLDCYEPSTGLHNGLPNKLYISLEKPVIAGSLTDFTLGTDFSPVEGRYSLYVPIAMTEKSKILYEKVLSGWNDNGKFDKIEIDSIFFNFFVSSDVPYEFDLAISPIDALGNEIKGVTVTIPHIDANADHQAVQAVVKGKVKSLDGIRLMADVTSADVAQLRPDMFITLDGIRAKVYGMYVKYDDD